VAKAKELVSPTSAPYHTWRALTLSLRTGHRVESAGKVRSPIHLSAQNSKFFSSLSGNLGSQLRGPLDAALHKLALPARDRFEDQTLDPRMQCSVGCSGEKQTRASRRSRRTPPQSSEAVSWGLMSGSCDESSFS
jgi:hypothetical protein